MSVGADDIELEDRVSELIERGLERYGRGDLEGALADWRHALVLEPDERRASEYVAYVEKHYELLDSGHVPASDPTLELTAPFGIDIPPGLADDELDVYESIEVMAESTDADRRAAEEGDDDGYVDIFADDDSGDVPLELDTTAPGQGAAVEDGWMVEESRGPAARPPARDPAADPLAETADLSSMAAVLRDGPAGERTPTEPPSFRREQTQEGTVPGGRTPPPLEDSALSTEAITALASSDDIPIDVGPFEATVDRSEALAVDLEPETLPFEDRSRDLPAFEDRDDSGAALRVDEEDEATNFRVRDQRWTASPEEGRRSDPDEELTAERATKAWSGAAGPTGRRAPTEDPGLDAVGLELDDALLSLEDATRELDIRDVIDPDRGDATPAPGGVSVSVAGSPELDIDLEPGRPELDIELEPGRPELDIELDPAPAQESSSRQPADALGDEAIGAELLAEIDADAPADETEEERLRRRVQRLLDRAHRDVEAGEARRAVLAAELAISEHPDSVVVQKAIADRARSLQELYASFLGDLTRVPVPTLSLAELSREALDHRAGFLLSRVDGTLSFDDLLDVSGMPRLEALRHLSRLVLRGILDVP